MDLGKPKEYVAQGHARRAGDDGCEGPERLDRGTASNVAGGRTMTEVELCPLRRRIEALASERGEYYLVCSRYGDRPVPADGCRFESCAVARRAARLTEEYRSALRRYDPALPEYDIVVRQTPKLGAEADPDGAGASQ